MKTIEEIFDKIIEKLDLKNELREKIIKKSRRIIQNCGKCIKDIHNQKFEEIDKQIRDIEETIESLINEIKENNSEFLYNNNILIVYQEYTELKVFYSLINKDEYISFDELNAPITAYLNGLCDVTGELRRYCLDSIRKNDIDNAERALNYINEIYENLTNLNYPSGLIPNLRHKIDVTRSLAERTRSDVTIAWVMLRNKNA
ncbi:MAG: hypothetical protein ACTSYZ_05545 [Candidatus Helarchaeota archaeon]